MRRSTIHLFGIIFLLSLMLSNFSSAQGLGVKAGLNVVQFRGKDSENVDFIWTGAFGGFVFWDINQHLQVTEKVIQFLEENKNNHFFLFYHHSAPHAPYRFPKSELKKITNNSEFQKHYNNLKLDELTYAIFPQAKNNELNKIFKNDEEAKKHSFLVAKATTGMIRLKKNQSEIIKYLYKKEVEWTDTLLGKILTKLEELDLINNTIICFLADHGELLYEKGKFGHANDFMLNEVLNIPFIIYIPAIKGGKIIKDNISHVNILPTVLEIIGQKLDKRSSNRSLWNNISLNQIIKSKPVYSEGNFRISVIKDNNKYVTDTKRKTQIIGLKDLIKNSIHLIKNNSFSIDNFRDNLMLFLVPYYKRFIGIPKEELYEIIIKDNVKIQEPIRNGTIKKKMSKFIDDYYCMEKVDLTEDLTEEELKIIRVRLEALGYLEKK